jgi:hypothetical protein
VTAPVVVLMPVYNDWPILPKLLGHLDAALARAGWTAEVVVVDDGSSVHPDRKELVDGRGFQALQTVTVVRLGRNVGHQQAIAIGLVHIQTTRRCEAVVVMDADGEDSPDDVPRLLAAWAAGGTRLVFAARVGRSEGLAFRALYRLYRWTYRLLTGTGISFGNFSVVPAGLLPRLVLLSGLGNHYAAAAVEARLPIETVPVNRAPRLGGKSRMTLVSLVLHGLSAIAVHGDVIGVRALMATMVAMALSVLGIGVVATVRLTTELAIPGWASFLVGLLVAILLQTVLLSVVFVFVILNSRNYSSVIPLRDFAHYVVGEEQVYPH